MTDDEKAALADVYERAAKYLEEYGWIQDELGRNGGPRCIMGAMVSVTERHTDQPARFACDTLELGKCPQPSCSCGGPLAHWNDEEGRTADEVINTLHALANKLR